MRKTIFSLSMLFLLLSFGFANSQLEDAISRMNQNGLTKFNNSTDFMADKSLRRDEATKFFGQYAITIQKSTVDETKTECNGFNDLNEGREDLKGNMQNACKLGLFKGSQGKFMPKGLLTNGQAITVLIRMIDGYKDESQGHFAQKYYEKAQQLELLNGVDISPSNFDTNITRGDIAKLIYNSSKNNNKSDESNTNTNTNSVAKNDVSFDNLVVQSIYGSTANTTGDWIQLYDFKKEKVIYFTIYKPDFSWENKIISFEKKYNKYVQSIISSSYVSIKCYYFDGKYCYGDLWQGEIIGKPGEGITNKLIESSDLNEATIDTRIKATRGHIEKSVKYPKTLNMGTTFHEFNFTSGSLEIWGSLDVNDDSGQSIKGGYLLQLERNIGTKEFDIKSRYVNIPDSALIDSLRKREKSITNTVYVPVYQPTYITTTYIAEDWETCRQRVQKEYSFKGVGRGTAVTKAIESECGAQP